MASKPRSYGQIIKSTMLMGGSSLVNVGLSVIRNKTMAVLLGPEGVGLMGLYLSIVEIAQALAGLGVSSSGVRQVAEAVATGDEAKIVGAAKTVRWISMMLAVLGTLLLAALAAPVSFLTFGDNHHTLAIVLLSGAVFFRLVASGQAALIQGMRGVGDLACINVIAALFSTILSIPLIYLFREQAIVPCLVLIAAVSLLPSWWFSRHIAAGAHALALSGFRREGTVLLKLGAVFMASALLTSGAAYAIRIIVLQNGGIPAAGLYQAAWALGGLYAGFILQAMSTDFYPRLTAAAADKAECNRLVNEQTEVSILLAGPGLVATLTVAPLIMNLFYSAEFKDGGDLLRWICLGMMLRILAWPMGFIVIARSAQMAFFLIEVAAALVHVGSAWIFVEMLGVSGAGIAYLTLYIWHGGLVYVIARRLTDFRWSAANGRHALLFLPASVFVFLANAVLPPAFAIAVGSAVVILTGLYSLRALAALLPLKAVPAIFKGWMTRSA